MDALERTGRPARGSMRLSLSEPANSMTDVANAESFDPSLVQPPLSSARKLEVLQTPLNAEQLVPDEVRT